MYDRETFRQLLTPAGQALLEEADQVEDGLSGLTRLRQRHDPALASLAHLTSHLRRKARARFSCAATMYFLPEALEQATAEAVARYKAGRFSGTGRVADLACGIGGDSLALAREAVVIGVDRDGLRLMMARENVKACSPRSECRWIQADITACTPCADAFHLDPSRRRDGRRFRRGSAFQPPLSFLDELVQRIPDGALCLGPATPLSPRLTARNAEVEAISWQGECKDTILWTGNLRRDSRSATMLPEQATISAVSPTPSVPVTEPLEFLAVPDPAAVRAHLVRELAESHGASLLDGRIALLTARSPRPTPWLRYHRVLAAFPFSRPRVRAELAAHGLDHVRYSFHGVALKDARLPGAAPRSGPVEALVFVVRRSPRILAVLTSPAPHHEPEPKTPLEHDRH